MCSLILVNPLIHIPSEIHSSLAFMLNEFKEIVTNKKDAATGTDNIFYFVLKDRQSSLLKCFNEAVVKGKNYGPTLWVRIYDSLFSDITAAYVGSL